MRRFLPHQQRMVVGLLFFGALLGCAHAGQPSREDQSTPQDPDTSLEGRISTADAAPGRTVAAPPPGQRWIVGLERTAPRRSRRDVRDLVQQLGGRVAVDSSDLSNTFVAFEGASPDDAFGIAGNVRGAGLRGVAYIEPDVPRYPMGRRLQGDELAAAVEQAAAVGRRRLQQATPYGLAAVQATTFTPAQRSTTSSVDPSKSFPICIIDSGFTPNHPGLLGVRARYIDPTTAVPDTCGHGTHVAGTVAGRTTGVLNGNVELLIVQVFDSPGCGWVYASGLAVAMKKCQDAGARVVSMSLGGGGASTAEENQINAMYAAQVLTFAAAGNDANSATSYPAGYANAISVAAVNSANARASFSNTNADVEVAAPGVSVLSSVPGATQMQLAVSGGSTYQTYSYSGTLELLGRSVTRAFTGQTLACSASACTGSFAGKVCVIPRSTTATNSPCAQATRCAAAGGVAAIITSGSYFWDGLRSCSPLPNIPMFALVGNSAIRNQFANGKTITGTLLTMALYESWDGTSMATPHASAVAALVWGQRPNCTAAVVRCAINLGALDLGAVGRDNSFGHGLVRASAALARLAPNCTCA